MPETREEIAEAYRQNTRDWQQAWAIDVDRDPWDIPLEEMDPAHPELFRTNKVLPWFERLRAESPVHKSANSQFGSFWSITRYDDVKYVDTHHDLFSSDIYNGGIRLGGKPLEGPPDPMFHLPMFIMADPPVHEQQRKAVAPMFAPSKLGRLADLIRKRAARILDELPRDETFNWVRRVSVELTGQMLATLFDVPQEDRHKLIHWSDTVERIADPDYFETAEEGFKELWTCFEYFNAIWQERAAKADQGEDLISFLARGEATRNMTPSEFLGNILLLIVGGNDTTRNSISGGVLALNQFPGEFEKLKANPGLIPNMVPEIVRWQSPVAHMCRTAMADTEIRGQQIRKWDKLCIWYLSGNRDEQHIPEPDRFWIERPQVRNHLAFGFGIHRCLGNRLAEMQLGIIWEEILKRFREVEVVGEPKYLYSNFIRGITDLPVRVRE
ncbi:MAG: cytochrome P450 [Gammaproteobacteria bacterium]|nr:cytochrome P450 [Gammaproteobacteria bacterium]